MTGVALYECPMCPQVQLSRRALTLHRERKHPVAQRTAGGAPTVARATPDWLSILCVRCRVPRKNRRYCGRCLVMLFAYPTSTATAISEDVQPLRLRRVA